MQQKNIRKQKISVTRLTFKTDPLLFATKILKTSALYNGIYQTLDYINENNYKDI